MHESDHLETPFDITRGSKAISGKLDTKSIPEHECNPNFKGINVRKSDEMKSLGFSVVLFPYSL